MQEKILFDIQWSPQLRRSKKKKNLKKEKNNNPQRNGLKFT